MRGWIDFKALRSRLNFEKLLEFYGVEVKRKGDQHLGFCPLPGHVGKRNSVSFSANLSRGIFQCFGCGAHGNALEFAAFMENTSPSDTNALRRVAERLERELLRSSAELSSGESGNRVETPRVERKTPICINMPLDFCLKGLDQHHWYFEKRGFFKQTVEYFGLGFCSRGLLKGRIAIPLHDTTGQLIGYAGRVVEDSSVSEKMPKYKFPGERRTTEKFFQFSKQLFLYNGFRLKAPVQKLIVVEGFASVWWLHQNGCTNVVATMGAECSSAQGSLIRRLTTGDAHIVVLADGDKGGIRHAETTVRSIVEQRFVRVCKMSETKQPTDLAPDDIQRLLR